MIWHFGHYCVSLWSYDEDHIPDSISGSSHRAGWSPARCIRPAADGGRVPECQSDKRRFWVGSPPPVADYFPSGEKSRWNQNSSDGTQPTASPSCKESIGKHKQDGKKNFLRGALILTLDELKNSPDVVVIQPQHLQVFKQTDTLRNLGQTVVVQQ